MQILIILNDPPYGTERCYQGLRMADALLKIEEDLDLTVYLQSDAVACAKRGQQTPQGFYNVERMLKPLIRKGSVMACKTCLEARGLTQDDLMENIHIATLGELAEFTLEADKVLIY